MLVVELVLAVLNLAELRVPIDFLTAVPGFGGSIVNAVGGGTLDFRSELKLWVRDFLLLVELAGLSNDKFDAAWDNLVTGDGAVKSDGRPILEFLIASSVISSSSQN